MFLILSVRSDGQTNPWLGNGSVNGRFLRASGREIRRARSRFVRTPRRIFRSTDTDRRQWHVPAVHVWPNVQQLTPQTVVLKPQHFPAAALQVSLSPQHTAPQGVVPPPQHVLVGAFPHVWPPPQQTVPQPVCPPPQHTPPEHVSPIPQLLPSLPATEVQTLVLVPG
jgi:hypothetical protein